MRVLLLQLLLLVLILVVFLLRYDARPVGMHVEIHCEGFRRVAEKHLRALAIVEAQRALQRTVTDDTGAVDRATTAGSRRRAIFTIARSLAIAAARGSSGTAGAGSSGGDSCCHRRRRRRRRCLPHGRSPRLLVALALALFRLHVVVTTADSLCDLVLWPRYRLYPFRCLSLLRYLFEVDPIARPHYCCR